MKKILSLLAAVCCAIGIHATVLTGECGDNATYTLDLTAGTLTISGTGATSDYYMSQSSTPWGPYYDSIRTVVVEEGITTLGEHLFCYQWKAKSFTLPSTVTVIKKRAFYCCRGMESITLPSGLTTLGNCAFESSGLKSITVPNSVTSAGSGIFESCDDLEHPVYNNTFFICMPDKYARQHSSYTIPSGITTICPYAFYNTQLESVIVPASVTTMYEAFYRSRAASSRLRAVVLRNPTPPSSGYMTQGFYIANPTGGGMQTDKKLPIYVPATAYSAYKSSTCFSGYNVLAGDLSTFIADSIASEPKPQIYWAYVRRYGHTLTTDSSLTYMRYQLDSLKLVLADVDSLFRTDMMQITLERRTNQNATGAKSWESLGDDDSWVRGKTISTLDGYRSNAAVAWVRNPRIGSYDQQFRLKIEYILPGEGTIGTIYSQPIEAHCLYPVSVKEGCTAMYSLVKNDALYGWEAIEDTLWASAGQPIAYRMVDADECVGQQIRMADTHHYYYSATDTISTPSATMEGFSVINIPAPYEINPSEAEQITYSFVNWDKQLLSSQSLACDVAPTVPADPSREGYRFAGWQNEATGEMGAEVSHVNVTYIAVYDKLYSVTLSPTSATDHGQVQVSVTEAIADEMVTVTAIPDAGYHPEWVRYYLEGGNVNGVAVSMTPNADYSRYTGSFKMPSANVEVGAYFLPGTALEEVSATASASKVVEDGRLFILVDGVRYDALGRKVN